MIDILDTFDQILEDARGGSADAYSKLYRHFNPYLLRYLKVRVPYEYEDLASDVWVETTKQLHKFRGTQDEFRRLFFTIAFRRAVDANRRTNRRKTDVTATEEFDQNESTGESPESFVLTQNGTDESLALLRQLPPDQAEVIAMRIIAGINTADVARILHKREGSVRVLQHRGLARLAEILAKREGGVTE